LDEKIEKFKGKEKNSNKSNKNLLNAINSQIFDQYKINPYQNTMQMQMQPNHAMHNSLGYVPTQYMTPSIPMNYHSPYVPQASSSVRRKSKNETNDADEEISHFSGDEIDLKVKPSEKKTPSKVGKENNVMKDGKEIKMTEQKRYNTNKVIKELNENLEDFHFEFSRQISKKLLNSENLKRAQEKISVEELANELDQLKKVHKKNVEDTDKKREYEFQKFLDGMKLMKNEISEKLSQDQEKNNENIASLSNDFKVLKQDISIRIDNIETKQKQQMENVKNLLEAGTSGKSKNLIKKIITGKNYLIFQTILMN
jgi:hypothetical protein